MKIALSGSNGMIGSALLSLLQAKGVEVFRLVRSNQKLETKDIYWSPQENKIDQDRLEDLDAVIHLAGENIASGRWSEKRKQEIRESRVKGTRLIAQSLAELKNPPKTFLSASAIGFYGDRGDERLDEKKERGGGFLASLCQEWEKASESAQKVNIRVVNLRIGLVLSAKQGALAKMLLPFQMGVGGIIGDGKQYMSWIALDDLVGAIFHILEKDRLNGPVNIVSPFSVTNFEFTKTLGNVLKRPTVIPMPAFLARMAFGEMADELLLSSSNVEPLQLLNSGYNFRYPKLEAALKYLLSK